MLSEVCTPDDFQNIGVEDDKEAVEKSILRAVGSTLVSPKEEVVPSTSQAKKPIRRNSSVVYFGVSGFGGFIAPQRPRISRTSTSGTQIFTPNEDGIELDGLPVGPEKEIWAKGGRRERTYL